MFTLLNCETLIFFTKIWVKGTRLRVQDGRFYSTEGKARQKRHEAPPGPKAARSAAPSDRPTARNALSAEGAIGGAFKELQNT